MIKFHLILTTLCLVFSSCGSVKNVEQTEVQKNVSKADHPYIELFHQAVRLGLKGNVDEAIENYKQCLLIKQDDDAVYYALAQLYESKKQNDLAIQMAQSATKVDPDNLWYVEKLASLYYQNNQFEQATPHFKQLVENNPKNLRWLYAYGDCLLRQGKVEEAIGVLNKAEDVVGKNPSLSLEKYRLLMSVHKEEDALLELTSIIAEFPDETQIIATIVDHYFKQGNYQEGVKFLKKLSEQDPENGRYHLVLGQVYLQEENFNDAFTELRAAFSNADVPIDEKMNVMVTFQESPLETSEDVKKLANILVETHPTDAKSYSIRGDFYMAQQNDLEALKDYKKAILYEKNLYPLWNQVLILEMQQELWDSLFVDSKNCLNYFTTTPIVYLLNGMSAIKLKQYDDAIDVLQLGMAVVVNDVRMKSEFLGQMGDAYLFGGQLEKGREKYEEAIAINPQSNLLKNNYAYSLAGVQHQLDNALKLINQAIDNSPNQANYYDTRAFVYFKQGKYQEAIKDYLKAISLNKQKALFHEHLGDAYAKNQQIEKALESWNQALELNSNNSLLKAKIKAKKFIEE